MPEIKRISTVAIAAVLALAATPVVADPWLKPGDLALRHDIQLLADAGVLKSPVTTWPITWATVAADLASSGDCPTQGDCPHLEDPAVLAARARVLQRFNRVRGLGGFQPNAKLGVRSDDFWLRTFEDTPREQGEARAGVSWMGERFAARAQLSFASDPRPGDQEWRGDGSYLAAVIGNHIVHAGALDRWWGPSRDDTLILSSNARPVPGFGIERSAALPFKHKWLNWIGPWTYSFYWGFLESNRAVPNARLTAFRLAFRPMNDLEIGLTRTAQWCGRGRPCSAGTFTDIVIGDDNVGDSGVTEDNEPGNQLAALDFRWQAPFTGGPWAIYGQAVAEDEAGGFPSRYFAQFGGERWGMLDSRLFSGQWRAHLEYTNTLVHFWQADQRYNMAYEHGIYQSGYRFEGRSLGAAADGDSQLISAGLMLADEHSRTWNGLLRFAEINNQGAGLGRDLLHSVSPDELKLFGAQLSHRRPLRLESLDLGMLSAGVGVQYADNRITGESGTDVQAFVQWTWDYSGL